MNVESLSVGVRSKRFLMGGRLAKMKECIGGCVTMRIGSVVGD